MNLLRRHGSVKKAMRQSGGMAQSRTTSTLGYVHIFQERMKQWDKTRWILKN